MKNGRMSRSSKLVLGMVICNQSADSECYKRLRERMKKMDEEFEKKCPSWVFCYNRSTKRWEKCTRKKVLKSVMTILNIYYVWWDDL